MCYGSNCVHEIHGGPMAGECCKPPYLKCPEAEEYEEGENERILDEKEHHEDEARERDRELSGFGAHLLDTAANLLRNHRRMFP